jgi:hypothetical protein
MTKTLSMVSYTMYNLSTNEGFVIFMTSVLIIHFIDGVNSKNEIPINFLFTEWK